MEEGGIFIGAQSTVHRERFTTNEVCWGQGES